jgi:hypothetical protein
MKSLLLVMGLVLAWPNDKVFPGVERRGACGQKPGEPASDAAQCRGAKWVCRVMMRRDARTGAIFEDGVAWQAECP